MFFFFGCQLVTPGEWETDGDGASLFKAGGIYGVSRRRFFQGIE